MTLPHRPVGHGSTSSRSRSRCQRRRRGLFTRLLALLAALALVVPLSSGARAQEGQVVMAPRDVPDGIGLPPEVAVPPIPSTFRVVDAGWVRFAHPGLTDKRIRALTQEANEARASLTAELGRPVLDTIEVRIARGFKEMQSLAPVGMPPPDYAEGVAYARLRLILVSLVAPNSNEPPNLAEVLRHELAHIALHDAVDGHPVPRWFNEGFAVHASGESSLVRTRTLWTATLSKRILPMSDLDKSFPANSDLAAVAYAQSADFVRFLLRRQDRNRFAMFVERLGRGQEFDSALADAYAVDTRRLEYQWREEIRRRYSWVPVLLGSGLLWVGAFVLLGIGWYRRKRRSKKTLERWAREEAEQDRRAMEERRQATMIAVLRRADDSPDGEIVLATREKVVPKVQDSGRWHTLH